MDFDSAFKNCRRRAERRCKRHALQIAEMVLIVGLGNYVAQGSAADGWFPIPPTAIYETGDSWKDRDVSYRLYGVQSCIRGTGVTNAYGLTRDCGEASLAMLIALSRDLHPQCYKAGESSDTKTVFVFCMATLMRGAAAGSRIDLGTALISMGYAFAALSPDGQPVHLPYLAAERVAQKSRAGLWAFDDLPDPNKIIRRALGAESGIPPLPSSSIPPVPH